MPAASVFVDHVSIAVPRIGDGLEFFQRHFPVAMGHEPLPGYSGDFNWCDFYLGNFKLELIEPASDTGFVRRFLDRRGPGMHHWSLEAHEIDPILARMEADGVRIVDRFDAGTHKTAFVSPRSAHGVLIQFWQVPGAEHETRPAVAPFRLRDGREVRMRVDHVSIAVRDIDAALAFFRRYLPVESGQARHRGYDQSFELLDFRVNGYKVELIQGVAERPGFVHRFLERRGEGLHHLSIDIDDLDPYLAELEADGVRVVDRFDLGNGWKTAFISPRSAFGVLIQFWQTGEALADEGGLRIAE